MNDSMLKKINSVLIIITCISLIWAVGASSRKKVELEKSKELNDRLEKLIQANTTMAEDLKIYKNKLAEVKTTEQNLKNTLAEGELKNQSLRTNLDKTQQANDDLMAELEKIKELNTNLEKELAAIKGKNTVIPAPPKPQEPELQQKPDTKAPEEKVEQPTKKSNFGW